MNWNHMSVFAIFMRSLVSWQDKNLCYKWDWLTLLIWELCQVFLLRPSFKYLLAGASSCGFHDADMEGEESEKNAFEKEEVMLISIDNNGVIKSRYSAVYEKPGRSHNLFTCTPCFSPSWQPASFRFHVICNYYT